MTLTQMDVKNPQGNTLSLPLGSTAGGYLVKEIDGLDPVNATLTSAQIAQVDGAQLQATSRTTRNITAKLGFAPDYDTKTVVSLRKNLYQYMLPESPVVLSFYDNGVINAVINGTVESLTAPFFSQDPEMDLSVICYDPDFQAPAAITVDGSTVTDTTTQTVVYTGTSAAGMIFSLNVNTAVTSLTLYNTQPDGTIQLFELDNLSLVSGDVVTINTIPGQKAVTYTRASVVTSLLYAKSQQSKWPSFKQGNNKIRCLCSAASVPYTVTYTPKLAAL